MRHRHQALAVALLPHPDHQPLGTLHLGEHQVALVQGAQPADSQAGPHEGGHHGRVPDAGEIGQVRLHEQHLGVAQLHGAGQALAGRRVGQLGGRVGGHVAPLLGPGVETPQGGHQGPASARAEAGLVHGQPGEGLQLLEGGGRNLLAGRPQVLAEALQVAGVLPGGLLRAAAVVDQVLLVGLDQVHVSSRARATRRAGTFKPAHPRIGLQL